MSCNDDLICSGYDYSLILFRFGPMEGALNRNLFQTQENSILDDETTSKRIEINLKRNKKQDNTEIMDELSASFNYNDCKNEM